MPKSARERIREMPRPLTKSLSAIGKELDVSRQYVHQVVTEENIPYAPFPEREFLTEKLCKNLHCSNFVPNHRRAYCDECKDRMYEFRRTGLSLPCDYPGCERLVYRRRSLLERMPIGRIFCSRKHYDLFRRDGANAVSDVLSE